MLVEGKEGGVGKAIVVDFHPRVHFSLKFAGLGERCTGTTRDRGVRNNRSEHRIFRPRSGGSIGVRRGCRFSSVS